MQARARDLHVQGDGRRRWAAGSASACVVWAQGEEAAGFQAMLTSTKVLALLVRKYKY